ncbi:hypothetical protein ACJRO7_009054 [Eucalyptus globulus]|uniref:Uncharacterized protein n=1 Tax=Eucalyptus globulus TaxID=34317 RepID=A0ABD3IUC3_EUCGL
MTGPVMVTKSGGCGSGGGGGGSAKKAKTAAAAAAAAEEEQNQLSVLALLATALRKSMASCRVERGEEMMAAATATVMTHHMEIGWPTNVRHVTHVTFDRFHGFLGLPVEFEVEIPCRVPSASVSVFGVSAESMQCSYDSRGNSVPSILLLMQERLYSQDGLKAEGIFRINPENSKEEHVRDQLNRGIVPDDIDVHCLAGLIKAWFRELPSGVLDGLSPEQVLQCNTEEASFELVKQLKPTESALLNWAVGLMADVVEEEEFNKMNARNIAMVFAPNMTQMSDPLTALMHAVQVMNLLKTLIMKTLREREEAAAGGYSPMSSRSSGQQSDYDYDSQHEMDTSCELRGPTSDLDDNDDANDSRSCVEEHEGRSLSEIEDCFLRQLEECNHAENANVSSERPSSEVEQNDGSPTNCLHVNDESGISFTDSKNRTSTLTTSDGEDSGTSWRMGEAQVIDIKSPQKECERTNDMEMVDLFSRMPSVV